MEKAVVFRKSGNRPDIGHFEEGDRKTLPSGIADELVGGRIAKYAPRAKKDPPAKAGKEA